MDTSAFLVYRAKNLRKINSIRRAISAPDAKLPPILSSGQVLYSSPEDAHNEPRSCYNCPFYNYGRSCKLIGQDLKIRKFIWPPTATSDSKQIEYWPVCGMWAYGNPNYGKEMFTSSISPDDAGLCWINAPSVGQDKGGACCGGCQGGDDCDYYMTDSPDKRNCATGFCRVLQKDVPNMACCTAWTDDDLVSWKTAQERIKNG